MMKWAVIESLATSAFGVEMKTALAAARPRISFFQFPQTIQADLDRPVFSRKTFRFRFDPNHGLIPRHPVPPEGRFAIVTDVGAGDDGRGTSRDE